MALTLDRRQLLIGGLGLAGLSLSPCAFAAAAKPTLTPLNDRLALISGVGGNVLALSAEEGLLLVDGGAPDHTRALLAALRGLPGGKHVHTLFNTHWHLEQTGSNEALSRSGAKIVAHEKTKLWLATDHWLPEENRYAKARPKAALPTETFYTRGAMTAGAEHVEYGYLLEAHTDGDIYVYCRDSNVLAVGDAASPVRDPELDWYAGGWLGGRVDSLALLLTLSNAGTRIVPGFGPVMTRADLQVEHDMMLKIFDRVQELMRKGFRTEDMLEAGVMRDLSRTWKDPARFLHDAHKSMWAHHNTLSHDIV